MDLATKINTEPQKYIFIHVLVTSLESEFMKSMQLHIQRPLDSKWTVQIVDTLFKYVKILV